LVQERFELVLKDAAAGRFLGVIDVGGARTQRVQAGEFWVGQVTVATRLVDQVGQLDVGQPGCDVGGRPRDRGDGDPAADGDVGQGQRVRAVRVDPGDPKPAC
jgi:hypothetical protein